MNAVRVHPAVHTYVQTLLEATTVLAEQDLFQQIYKDVKVMQSSGRSRDVYIRDLQYSRRS